MVVFVIGGITRSEMRVVHLLSRRLGREIVLGGTSLDDPARFLHHLFVSSLQSAWPLLEIILQVDRVDKGVSGGVRLSLEL